MKKIIIIIAIIIIGFISFLVINHQKLDVQYILTNIGLSKVRPEIKTYIDELYDSEITSTEHTTDSIEQNIKRLPDTPKSFDAGRYEIVFDDKNNGKKAMIFQTEEKVGHLASVTPGETDIGGFIEIQKNTENQNKLNNLQDLKLNNSELDYLIRTLYRKFEKPLTNIQADNLNRTKDYALAIKFSGKNRIIEYHNDLIEALKK
jgi:hypothetical protein